MKLLADENIPLESIEILINQKFDVLSVSKNYPGVSDRQIIDLSNQEERTIITFDKDFGQLIFQEGLLPKKGVIYLRMKVSPVEIGKLLLRLFKSSEYQFEEMMTVVENNFIRQRKF